MNRIFDAKNGLNYTLHGDYYLPELSVPETLPLGRWGHVALDAIKKQHPIRYSQMLLDGTLYPYCHEIDQQAQERFATLMDGYQRCWDISERLKEQDQMKWVGFMNQARHEAEASVLEMIMGDNAL